jgi:hypothetical protein
MGCKIMLGLALAPMRPEVGSSPVTVQKSPFFVFMMIGPSALHLTVRVGVWVVLGLGIACGCGERHDARAEADALMTSLNAVSDNGSFVERSAALEHLDQLVLHFPTHAQVRDLCGAAHKGLLEAEVAQAEARRALSSVSHAAADEAGNGEAQPALEQVQAERIAADIERSNKALAMAKERFPECETAMRNLLREAR